MNTLLEATGTVTCADPVPFAPWPYFADEEVAASAEVLRSGRVNYWTGNEGRLFEQEFATFAGCKYAVALCNGSVAIELALRALDIGQGDEVVTTSRTFIATASSIVAVGARSVFADVDLDSQNITAQTIAAVLTPKTRAIIAVHLAGRPCEMDEINALAQAKGLFVIEDCAQAHGALYKGRPVGSLGDIAAFSFCQDKHMTTAGEGGMVTTSSRALWQRMWSYKDHGKDFDTVYHTEHAWGFRWLHHSFGSNFRLSEVQSAVGRVALRRLPDWIVTRRKYAATMEARLGQLPALRIPATPQHIEHSYYKFYAFVRPEVLSNGWDRQRIAQAISEMGVPCTVGSCSEIYREQAFPADLRPPQTLAAAEELGRTSLMFLLHPTLSPEAIDYTCHVVEQILFAATGRH